MTRDVMLQSRALTRTTCLAKTSTERRNGASNVIKRLQISLSHQIDRNTPGRTRGKFPIRLAQMKSRHWASLDHRLRGRDSSRTRLCLRLCSNKRWSHRAKLHGIGEDYRNGYSAVGLQDVRSCRVLMKSQNQVCKSGLTALIPTLEGAWSPRGTQDEQLTELLLAPR